MVKTKPLGQVVDKWKSRIPNVAKAYQDGVRGTDNWQSNSLAGEELYKEQVTRAAAEGRRADGIQKVSNEEWKSAAADKGAKRIGAGMTAAIPKFQAGIQAVLSTIEGVSLPARVADPEQNVMNRVMPIVKALAALKK